MTFPKSLQEQPTHRAIAVGHIGYKDCTGNRPFFGIETGLESSNVVPPSWPGAGRT